MDTLQLDCYKNAPSLPADSGNCLRLTAALSYKVSRHTGTQTCLLALVLSSILAFKGLGSLDCCCRRRRRLSRMCLPLTCLQWVAFAILVF